MGLTQKLGTIPLAILTDSSNNVGIGAAANASFKLQVTGATNLTGVLTLGSTISNGTYTYTLPSATGTLALTSALSGYLPLTGGTLTGALSGTSATFSTEVTSSGSQGRFGGWATGAGYQGNALEVGVSGGIATLIGYNRTSGAYIPVLIGGNTNQTTTIGGNTIVLQNNGTTALTIASTGAATFNTSATTAITMESSASASGLRLKNNGGTASDWIIQSDGGVAATAAFRIYSVTADAYRMSILGNGNVGIGTSSPLSLLQVGGIGNASVRFGTSSTTNTSSTYSFVAWNSSGNDVLGARGDGLVYAPFIYSTFTTGAAANMGIDTAGGFYRSVSSIKYKKNVENYTKGLAEVMQIRPVFYNSINEKEDGTLYAGLIAEEIHELGLTEFVQYAEDGSPDALAYQNMIALAFKAIQEQQAQIEELRQIVATK
jgi:hypothetical protein